jgi:phosphinothricin acetyltransferase
MIQAHRGYVYAGRHRERPAYQWSVDVTAYVRDDARGRALASGCIWRYSTSWCGWATSGLAGIALPNAASVTLHETVGFQHLGTYRNVGFKWGAWYAVGWWQKTLREPAEPVLPKAFLAERST